MVKIPVIIPARSGSKGIRGKNLLELCGKPLIAWSIERAVNSECVSNVYVSTDGFDIAETAVKYGASVIERPEDISGDTASSESALLHAISEIEKTENFDNMIFLQATSPLREKEDIDNAYEVFVREGYDSLFSMAVMDDYTLWSGHLGTGIRSLSFDYRNRGRRQDREPIYLENGSIYILKKDLIKKYNNRLGGRIGMYEMPFHHSFEIDSESEVGICEFYLNKILEKEKYNEKSIL